MIQENIKKWHDEYITNCPDAIISNTSGCGTTLNYSAHIFKITIYLKQ